MITLLLFAYIKFTHNSDYTIIIVIFAPNLPPSEITFSSEKVFASTLPQEKPVSDAYYTFSFTSCFFAHYKLHEVRDGVRFIDYSKDRF